MHGTTMVFLVGMPILFGFGNYLVPLMIGARDMAFPRLNAFSFWISAFGGTPAVLQLHRRRWMAGTGQRAGHGVVCVCAADGARVFAGPHDGLLGAGAAGERVRKHRNGDQILATVFCMRCKGMTLFRMPLLPWLYADRFVHGAGGDQAADGCQAMLMIDRYLGGHFFDTQAGGSAILWAHFFWIFGHPEVYVLVLPAFAFANEIIPVFSRRRSSAIRRWWRRRWASRSSAWACGRTTCSPIGMTSFGNAFFTLSTMLVAIPTGIKIFNWLATMWGGRSVLRRRCCSRLRFSFSS